jgi:hypothetical protein
LRAPGIESSVGQPTEGIRTVLKDGMAGMAGLADFDAFDAAFAAFTALMAFTAFAAVVDARWRFDAPSAWPKRVFGATVMSNLLVQVPNRGAAF